jgi:hypothetical protein
VRWPAGTGATPWLNLVYVHLNQVIRNWDLNDQDGLRGSGWLVRSRRSIAVAAAGRPA